MPQFDVHFFSSLLFWSLISFGILLFLMKRYALPPILEMLEAREKKIRDSLDRAEVAKQEAEQRLAQYEAKLKLVHEEARAILEAARKQAQDQLDENGQRVKQETQRMLAEARSEIERQQRKALLEVQRMAVDLSLLAAEKILARNLKNSDHHRLVEEAVQEISDQVRSK